MKEIYSNNHYKLTVIEQNKECVKSRRGGSLWQCTRQAARAAPAA